MSTTPDKPRRFLTVTHVDDGDDRVFVRMPLFDFALVVMLAVLLGRCSE